jgi:hypothetical protein
MIVYEVNVEIGESVFDAYRAWLSPHVAEILALRGFVSAEIFERRDPLPPTGKRALTVCYRLVDAAALRDYLKDHAPRLREDAVRRFGDAASASRRVLESLEASDSPDA